MNIWRLTQANDYFPVEIWGRNSDIDSGSAPETLWEQGGLYVWQTAAEALELVSSSANDTSAGTGARTVLVQGLNASYVPIEETVSMNGTSPVALVNTYLRINQIRILTVGSIGWNAGTITLRVPGPGAVRSTISFIGGTGMSVGQTGRYTVPAGAILICNFLLVGVESNGTNESVVLGVFSRLNTVANSPWTVVNTFGGNAGGTTLFNLDTTSRYLKFTEKQDVEFKALQAVGDNIAAQIRMSGLLLVVQP